MAASFRLKIMTPRKLYLDQDAESISVELIGEGNLTLLAHHLDLLGNLAISQMTVKSNGHVTRYAVSGGIFDFHHKENLCIITTDAIEAGNDIDLARAQAAKEKAEKEIESSSDIYQTRRAEIRLKKALNRISTKSKAS